MGAMEVCASTTHTTASETVATRNSQLAGGGDKAKNFTSDQYSLGDGTVTEVIPNDKPALIQTGSGIRAQFTVSRIASPSACHALMLS